MTGTTPLLGAGRAHPEKLLARLREAMQVDDDPTAHRPGRIESFQGV